MSREILFRGKRTDNDKWLESVCPLGTLDTGAIINGVYPDTVCQYTGLKDCNGKMIFEGDIVDMLRENVEVGVIEWDESTARFIVSAGTFCVNFDNYYSTAFEVIGNIYDNPELLEGVAK